MQRTIALGPESGALEVKTTREGIAAGIGHDLTLRAQSWEGGAEVDLADSTVCSVRVEVDVDSLTVVSESGGLKPLTPLEKREVHRNMRRVLNVKKYPSITFQSHVVTGTPEAFEIDGLLEIMDHSERVVVAGSLVDGRAKGSVRIRQSDWGVRPFTSLFGALKVADEVTVQFDLEVPAE